TDYRRDQRQPDVDRCPPVLLHTHSAFLTAALGSWFGAVLGRQGVGHVSSLACSGKCRTHGTDSRVRYGDSLQSKVRGFATQFTSGPGRSAISWRHFAAATIFVVP